MFKFRVTTGKHRQDGRVYKPGDTFFHARRLDQEFVNKFEFLGESSPQAEKQKSDVKRDLTSRFPVARRLGYQIWGQDRNRYFIVDSDGGEVNDIPWKKAQVDQWLEGQEREDSAPSQVETSKADSTPTKKKKPGRPPKSKQKEEESEEDSSDEDEDFEDMGLE